MNYMIYERWGDSFYVAVTLPGTPTSAQASSYESDLASDVDYAHPIALNQWSIPGYEFYYQPNQAWQHWLVGRGYSSSGVYTVVNDPGFSRGIDATVPSSGGAGGVMDAIGGRGYIW